MPGSAHDSARGQSLVWSGPSPTLLFSGRDARAPAFSVAVVLDALGGASWPTVQKCRKPHVPLGGVLSIRHVGQRC